MVEIEEVKLPGVGVRYDLVTRHGKRVGVIAHRSGHRELLLYDERDPDACREVLRLEEEETRALAEMLGASHVTETVTKLQSVEGLTIDWLPVETGSAWAERTIGHTELRRTTGVSIVAVIRGQETNASPSPDFRMQPGDVAVAVGTPDGIRRAFALLRGD